MTAKEYIRKCAQSEVTSYDRDLLASLTFGPRFHEECVVKTTADGKIYVNGVNFADDAMGQSLRSLVVRFGVLGRTVDMSVALLLISSCSYPSHIRFISEVIEVLTDKVHLKLDDVYNLFPSGLPSKEFYSEYWKLVKSENSEIS